MDANRDAVFNLQLRLRFRKSSKNVEEGFITVLHNSQRYNFKNFTNIVINARTQLQYSSPYIF